jgi:thioesterase domain-containing protein
MARDYLVQIRTIQECGPYHLLGWSLGGIIAHAIAAAIRDQGEDVALLAVLDSAPLDLTQPIYSPGEAEIVRAIAPDLGLNIDFEKEGAERPETVAEMFALVRRFVREVTPGEEAIVYRQVQFYRRGLEIMRMYTLSASPFAGNMLCFAAAENTALESRWKSYVQGEITVQHIPCTHGEMMKPAFVSQIGSIIRNRILRMPRETDKHPART